MPKILFVAAHRPDRSPSQRFRFEQYFNYLRLNGWEVNFSFILDKNGDSVIYSAGNYAAKAWLFITSFIKRIRDIRLASNADIVFVQREAFMTGTYLFERAFARGSKLVFDFDDSIWIFDENPKQGFLNRLKNPKKTSKIIGISDLVIAGNQYLADYAMKYNPNVKIIPTTIETKNYAIQKEIKSEMEPICLGWSGSFSTIKHFETILSELHEIKEKFKDQVYFKVMGDSTFRNEALEIVGTPWTSETEISELSEIDIGLMPLPDDKWTKGKCGLKGLQYMALGIPTIMSPVGVNTEIIKHGENGFLASTREEWIDVISKLVKSPKLRVQIGNSGRKTVEEKYSVEANKEKYLQFLNELITENTSPSTS